MKGKNLHLIDQLLRVFLGPRLGNVVEKQVCIKTEGYCIFSFEIQMPRLDLVKLKILKSKSSSWQTSTNVIV